MTERVSAYINYFIPDEIIARAQADPCSDEMHRSRFIVCTLQPVGLILIFILSTSFNDHVVRVICPLWLFGILVCLFLFKRNMFMLSTFGHILIALLSAGWVGANAFTGGVGRITTFGFGPLLQVNIVLHRIVN